MLGNNQTKVLLPENLKGLQFPENVATSLASDGTVMGVINNQSALNGRVQAMEQAITGIFQKPEAAIEGDLLAEANTEGTALNALEIGIGDVATQNMVEGIITKATEQSKITYESGDDTEQLVNEYIASLKANIATITESEINTLQDNPLTSKQITDLGTELGNLVGKVLDPQEDEPNFDDGMY